MLKTADFHLSRAEFQVVRDVVYDYCRISLNDEKQAMVRARLAKQIREGGFDSAAQYLQYSLLNRDSKAFTDLIDAITTNLTSFFREPEHFHFLAKTALPGIIQRHEATARHDPLLIWSAGCSSGEEAYSIAISILEATSGTQKDLKNIEWRILATDISTKVLTKARAGTYSDIALRAVPEPYRSKYFASDGHDEDRLPQSSVRSDICEIVRFRHLNLFEPWPFQGPFDLIFCRNVMIYFDKATQQTLIDRFCRYLKKGGLLITGHSESMSGIDHQMINLAPSIYEKM